MNPTQQKLMKKIAMEVTRQGKEIELLKRPTSIAKIRGGEFQYELVNNKTGAELVIHEKNMQIELNQLFEKYGIAHFHVDI